MRGVLFVDSMLLLGCCVRDVWCRSLELSGCVNVVSSVWCVLFLFYMYAFHMNAVCGYI